MTEVDVLLQNLALYPRWLVAVVAIAGAALLVWVLAKVLKWTIYLAAIVAFVCVVAGVIAWWLA